MAIELVKQDPEIKELLARCSVSTKATAQVFFGGKEGRFKRPFDAGHDEIFRALDGPEKKVAILAPRGAGKTSIVDLAFPARNIWFQQYRFIVMVSCSATAAVTQSENLKEHLLHNSMGVKLFGPVKSKESKFAQEAWTTSNGVTVMPRGAGQQVRGLLTGDDRPDLIIVDDLEDPENMPNEEQRKKLNEWFFGSLCPCVDMGSDNWKIVVIGTLLHEDCLVAKLQKDESFKRISLEICDDNYESKFPNYMPTEKVKTLAEEYRQRGLISTFFREYRNKAIAGEDCPFQAQHFKYYNESELSGVKDLETVVIVDPAKSTTVHSDYSSIIAVGYSYSKKALFVRDNVIKKLHPDQIVKEAFDMAERLNATVAGFEVTSLNEFITWPIQNYVLMHSVRTPWRELKARGKKEDRIAQLVPLYRQGLIYHNKSCCQLLEDQLLSFPRGEHDDGPDSLAYVIEMLDIGDRFFGPGGEAFGKAGVDEFEELKQMYLEDMRESRDYELSI